MIRTILKSIFCRLLKIHRYDNQMNAGLYAEGWDEFYMCKLCSNIKKRHMNGEEYETSDN